MTGRTLEEIEALAADATPGPWGFLKHDCKELPSIDSFEITFQNKYGTAWLQSSNTHGVTMDRDMSRKETAANAALLASARDLLAIAQGQRGELKAAETMLEGVLDTIAGIMTGYELQTEESIAWLEWHKMWKASKPARTA